MEPGIPSPLVDAERLRRVLIGPGQVWTQVSALASTGSTNADLAAAARAGAASGSVLVADHQSSGRGRFARVWQAPPGTSLAISALLRPPASVPSQRWLWLPLITGVAVADGLRAACAVDVALKWPNDVQIDGRKVCGILSERVDAGGAPAVVIGMGVNTTLTAEQLPVPTATSLALAGADVDPTAVVAGILAALSAWYLRWLAGDDLRAEYAARCTSVGRDVRVQLSPRESVEGHAVGVDAAGRLLVEAGGEVRAFSAGDVFHLR